MVITGCIWLVKYLLPILCDGDFGGRVGQAERGGHGGVRYFAVVDVKAGAQMRIVGHGFAPALVGESEDEGQSGAVESKSGSARYGSRHVRDAVVNDIVDQVGGVGMGGGAAGLET